MHLFRCSVALTAIMLSACAQKSLEPLGPMSAVGPSSECVAKKDGDVEKTICQADEKSAQLMTAYFDWKNDPAVWDVPLIVLASTAAGLLLFDGSKEALTGVGLGAGIIGVGRNYFAPADVQAALLDGANGYACLADIGRIVAVDKGVIEKVGSIEAPALSRAIASLRSEIASSDDATEKAAMQKSLDNGNSALDIFNKQRASSKFADSLMRSKARAISTGLLKRIHRKPVEFADLYKSLAMSAKESAELDLKKTTGQTPVGTTMSADESSQDAVDRLTNGVLQKTPNIIEATGKFDACVVNALAGTGNGT